MNEVYVQQVKRTVVIVTGQQGPEGVPGVSSDVLEKTVSVPIGGHRAVAFVGNSLVYFDCHNPNHFGKLLGVTLNAASAGGVVQITRAGEIEEPSWNFTPEATLYFGQNGLLTETTPTSGFLQVAGFSTEATKIFFDPQPAIKILE